MMILLHLCYRNPYHISLITRVLQILFIFLTFFLIFLAKKLDKRMTLSYFCIRTLNQTNFNNFVTPFFTSPSLLRMPTEGTRNKGITHNQIPSTLNLSAL